MIRRLIAPASAALSIALVGCGGNGQNPTFNASAYAGNYTAAYTRATGSMTITVDSTSTVTIVIADSTDGVYTGSGSTNHVGGFFITCTGKNGKSVSVNGTLKGSGIGRTASGTVSGAITVNYNANFTSAPDAAIWTNHYEGLWNLGSASGNMAVDVDSTGNLTGFLLTGGEQVNLTGKVFTNGSVTATGTSGTTSYSLRGALRLSPPTSILGDGQYTVNVNGQSTVGDFHIHDAIGG